MAAFILFISLLAYIFGQATGYGVSFVGIALIFSGLMSLGSYYYSDSLVLSLSGAHEVSEAEEPKLVHAVENLALAAGLPKPRVYLIESSAPNAFATGRDPQHAVICATRGLIEMMDKNELEGVIAHELSHVKDYDTRLMAIVAVLVGLVTILADLFMRNMWFGGRRDREEGGGQLQMIFIVLGIILAILSPLIASLIQLAISRRREFLADANGAYLTRYPEGLADALEKLAADKQPETFASNATAHLFIVNPFKGKDTGAWFAGLFDTHPPIEERIKILRSM